MKGATQKKVYFIDACYMREQSDLGKGIKIYIWAGYFPSMFKHHSSFYVTDWWLLYVHF